WPAVCIRPALRRTAAQRGARDADAGPASANCRGGASQNSDDGSAPMMSEAVSRDLALLPLAEAEHLPMAPERPRSDMKRIVVWGCVLLVMQFCVFGVWATVVPLRSAIIAPGFIKVHSKRKAVQHLEGGIIKSIFVRE